MLIKNDLSSKEMKTNLFSKIFIAVLISLLFVYLISYEAISILNFFFDEPFHALNFLFYFGLLIYLGITFGRKITYDLFEKTISAAFKQSIPVSLTIIVFAVVTIFGEHSVYYNYLEGPYFNDYFYSEIALRGGISFAAGLHFGFYFNIYDNKLIIKERLKRYERLSTTVLIIEKAIKERPRYNQQTSEKINNEINQFTVEEKEKITEVFENHAKFRFYSLFFRLFWYGLGSFLFIMINSSETLPYYFITGSLILIYLSEKLVDNYYFKKYNSIFDITSCEKNMLKQTIREKYYRDLFFEDMFNYLIFVLWMLLYKGTNDSSLFLIFMFFILIVYQLIIISKIKTNQLKEIASSGYFIEPVDTKVGNFSNYTSFVLPIRLNFRGVFKDPKSKNIVTAIDSQAAQSLTEKYPDISLHNVIALYVLIVNKLNRDVILINIISPIVALLVTAGFFGINDSYFIVFALFLGYLIMYGVKYLSSKTQISKMTTAMKDELSKVIDKRINVEGLSEEQREMRINEFNSLKILFEREVMITQNARWSALLVKKVGFDIPYMFKELIEELEKKLSK
ncbi:MAG: hypothetical protein ACTSYA_13150 [Candidatus Kariarchaeaceae archaeon]